MLNTNRWALAAFNRVLLAGAFCALSAYGALADPIIYKFTVQGPGVGPVPGFTATLDGVPIGGGDDVITFTFTADTSTVQTFSVFKAFGFTNSVGTGSFSIVDQDTMEVVAGGTFLPEDKIFVSVDDMNGGVGFGSNFDSGAGFPGVPSDAAYPLGIEFDAATTYVDFRDPIGVFGTASLSCAGFPDACVAPPGLATTDGELVIGGATGQFLSNEGGVEGAFVEEFPTVTPPPASVPEPSTWAMMLVGFASLGFAGYRQAKRASFQPV
jgi:PEP-CTERM motif